MTELEILPDCCKCHLVVNENWVILKIINLCKYHSNLKVGDSASPINDTCKQARANALLTNVKTKLTEPQIEALATEQKKLYDES